MYVAQVRKMAFSHFSTLSSLTVSDDALTVHQHRISLNSFLVKSVGLTRQWCHERVTHYKALSKHILHEVPMETADISNQIYYSWLW